MEQLDRMTFNSRLREIFQNINLTCLLSVAYIKKRKRLWTFASDVNHLEKKCCQSPPKIRQ